jgi:hypothetical protein
VLVVHAAAGVVPHGPLLATASETWMCVDATGLQPRQNLRLVVQERHPSHFLRTLARPTRYPTALMVWLPYPYLHSGIAPRSGITLR